MHEDLQRLAALDKLDREIAKRRQAIARADAALTEATTLVGERQRAKEAIEAVLADNRSQQLALQRTIKEQEANRDRATKALEMGHGDPAAAERQLARTSELIDTAETEQLELLEAQDEHDAALAQASEALTTAQATHAELKASVPETRTTETAALADLNGQRTVAHSGLPNDFATRYDDFRARNKWAVAPIVDGACGACRVDVPAQQRADLARGLIEPCRRCYRWVVPEGE